MNTEEKMNEIEKELDKRNISNTLQYDIDEKGWEWIIDSQDQQEIDAIFKKYNMHESLQYDFDEDEERLLISAYIFDKDYDD